MRPEKIDCHLHSSFSPDSNEHINDIVRALVKRGFTRAVFTEHAEYAPDVQRDWGVLDHEAYFKKGAELKEKYRDSIILGFGIEAGEPHRYPVPEEILNSAELVIGSVHMIPGRVNMSIRNEKPFTPEEIRIYYEENLTLVQQGGFHVLGHPGVYARYSEDDIHEKENMDIIREILKICIDKNIIPEVNYSALHYDLKRPVPSINVLKAYKALGGEHIAIGSDAHNAARAGAGYATCLAYIQAAGFDAPSYFDGEWIKA